MTDVEIADAPQPWERQPHETDEAWQAFKHFLMQGPERAVKNVAAAQGKSESLMYRWSSVWEWKARVQAWEAEQDVAWLQRVTNERRLVAQDHVDISRRLKAAALAGLERLNDEDGPKLTPMQLLEFLKAALAIEGGIFGVGTDNDERSHGVRIMIDPRLLPPGAVLPELDQ